MMYINAHDDENVQEFKDRFMEEPAGHMELVQPPLGIHVRAFCCYCYSVFSQKSL